MNLRDRLLRRRSIVPETGCWEWDGFRRPDGYVQIKVKGANEYIHRIAHEVFIGPIPDGFDVDHTCFNPPCFNPEHLESVTPEENLRRAWSRLRKVVRDNGRTGFRASHCKRGHELNEATTYSAFNAKRGTAYRRCIECRRGREGVPLAS